MTTNTRYAAQAQEATRRLGTKIRTELRRVKRYQVSTKPRLNEHDFVCLFVLAFGADNEGSEEEKFDGTVRCCVGALFRFNGALRWDLDDPHQERLAVWTRL